MRVLQKNKNILTVLLMISLTIFTQLLSIMKSSVVAGLFGSSSDMDAFNLSNNIVMCIFDFIAAGISTVVIPYYVKSKNNPNVDSFITILYSILFSICSLCILFRNLLIGILSDRDQAFVETASNILIILIIGYYLYSISNLTAAFFQCEGKYIIPKLVNLIAQVLVVGLLLFWKEISILEYSIIFSIGFIFNFVTDLFVALKSGWRLKISLTIAPETKKMFSIFLPTVVSTGVYRLSLLVDATISSRLDTGKITLLSYSSQVSGLINSIFIGNLLLYFYPKIVKRIKENKGQKQFWQQVVFFHYVVCFLIVAFITVGREGISFLFEHGKFNSNDTEAVYWGGLIYIVGLQTNVIRDMIYRYFYALGNTKIPARNSIFVSVMNIIISLILVYLIGFYGIILGTVLASLISLLGILRLFNKEIKFEISRKRFAASILVNIIISTIVCCVLLLCKYCIFNFQSNIVNIIVLGFEGVVLFSIMTFFFNKNIITAIKNI